MANTRMAGGLLALVLALSFSAQAAPAKKQSRAGSYEGPATAVGSGQARAFVTLGKDGKPTAIGVRLSEAALNRLPTKSPEHLAGVEHRLSLPKEAAGMGYDHVTVDWNPHGHVPPGVYDEPHFDFHFYLISPEERERITLVGEDSLRASRAPDPDFMPVGYALPEGTAEPGMGAHAIFPGAPEFNNMPFTKAFIYGFYDGHMVFLEPMVTKAYLERKLDVTEDVKLPARYQRPGYYPTLYRVRFDGTKKEYVVSLEGLVYHE